MPIDASADSIWEGVKNRYWHLPVYFVPTCTLVAPADGEAAGNEAVGEHGQQEAGGQGKGEQEQGEQQQQEEQGQ